MNINLNKEINAHFQRLKKLSDDVIEDSEERYSAKAAIMGAMTNLIKELTKTQTDVINMENLLKTEQAIIETAKEFLNDIQQEELAKKLKELTNV